MQKRSFVHARRRNRGLFLSEPSFKTPAKGNRHLNGALACSFGQIVRRLLFGLDAAGVVTWRRMCRFWEGGQLLTILGARLKPTDPEPSWECTLTGNEVRELAARFDPPDMLANYPDDHDLTELLQTPGTKETLLRIEEWGYG